MFGTTVRLTVEFRPPPLPDNPPASFVPLITAGTVNAAGAIASPSITCPPTCEASFAVGSTIRVDTARMLDGIAVTTPVYWATTPVSSRDLAIPVCTTAIGSACTFAVVPGFNELGIVVDFPP